MLTGGKKKLEWKPKQRKRQFLHEKHLWNQQREAGNNWKPTRGEKREWASEITPIKLLWTWIWFFSFDYRWKIDDEIVRKGRKRWCGWRRREDMEQMTDEERTWATWSQGGELLLTVRWSHLFPPSHKHPGENIKILLQPQNKPITQGAAAAVKLLEYLRSVLTTLSPAVLKQDTECQRGADMLFCSAAPDLWPPLWSRRRRSQDFKD